MDENHTLSDSELMKILIDPKKIKILDILKKDNLTVAQVAKQLGQKPSRLYYHFNKLEEAGLIQLTDTKQQGNLIEKYYGVVHNQSKAYKFDSALVARNYREIMDGIVQVIQPGLSLVEEDLKSGQKSGLNADCYIHYGDFTEKQWRDSFKKIESSIKKTPPQDDSEGIETHSRATDEEESERYVHVILSYRLSDAEK